MAFTLENITKKQKILGIALIILCLVFIFFVVIALLGNKVKAPTVDQPVSSATPPAVIEIPNDTSSDTGINVDYSLYPNPTFAALHLSEVIGDTRIPGPYIQFNGQPRVFMDCGRLITEDTSLNNLIKRACVARVIQDGAIAVLDQADNDYIYYRGKTRDDKTETFVHDISTDTAMTYLIYEYDYNTQSGNYIDRITLSIPEKAFDKLADFKECIGKPIALFTSDSCYAQFADKDWYNSNSYFLEHRDNYFRGVNLP
ncbi:MAG: hypothetical protein ABIM99_04565 [Candidatus Dojkabacteria bacterium]